MMNIIPSVNGSFIEASSLMDFPHTYETRSHYKKTDKLFDESLHALGYSYQKGAPLLIHYYKKNLAPEAYEMDISPNKIHVYAADEKGYYHALTTMYQMLVLHKGKLPIGLIEDHPEYSYRGLNIDVCRHFFSIDELKKIVRQCSILKLNALHLHLSDDQGFRIESQLFPKLNEIGSYRKLGAMDPLVTSGKKKEGEIYGGYYTQKEIKELVAFASIRQIEIIPEIELPGHTAAILASFPEFTCSGKPMEVKNQFGIFKRTACIGNPDLYPFLYQLISEVASLFPSPYFHIGGDETPLISYGTCPKCQKLMKKQKMKDLRSLQSYFMNKISAYLKSIGKTPIVYNESLLGGKLDKDVLIQYWNEMNAPESYSSKEIPKGRKFILSSMNNFYFDYPHEDIPLRAVLNYQPEMKDIPVPKENIHGLEACLWSEWIGDDKTLEKQLSPRLFAFAERAWSREKNEKEFLQRLKNVLREDRISLLDPNPIDTSNPQGKEAVFGMLKNMKTLSSRYHGDFLPDEDNVTMTVSESVNPEEQAANTARFLNEKMKYLCSAEEREEILQLLKGKKG